MKNHQLINQDSGNTEYYTPAEIVHAARMTMGEIDLDPASSEIANLTVKATIFFTRGDDVLERDWYGRIWMNHPFSRGFNRLWIEKLIEEYRRGNVIEACCITFAATSEKWFRPLLEFPQCFLYNRTNFYLPDGTQMKGVTKGCVVTYLGKNSEKFRENFRVLGAVKL
jgi:ParB family chromosome partitioning protein